MSKQEDSYYDDREIHVQEYDPQYTTAYREKSPEQHLNYYQRMQLERGQRDPEALSSGNTQPYSMNSRLSNIQGSDVPRNAYRASTFDDRLIEDEDDDDYDPGDTYDFGLLPKRKKKKIREDRPYENRRDNRRYDDYEDYEDRPKKRRRKRHPILRFLRNILIILIILFVAAYLLLHLAYSKLNRVDPVADTTADTITEAAGVTPYSESGVMNILLIGQDARSGETQTRSDTMIICSLNRKTGKITLVSLMRDTYVPIAGYYSDRLNAAYALGGMETLDATIQENFGIDIDGNVVIDLDGFLNAITSVGNLEITLTAEEAEYLNANPGLGTSDDGESVTNEVWTLTEGVNSMTSEQLLAYSRMRYVGNSDWDRTDRQKKVIQAAFSKVRSNPIRLLQTINNVAPSVITDMSDSYLTKALLLGILCGTDMQTYTIPGDSDYTSETIDGASVLVPDLTACSARLRSYLYDSNSSSTTLVTDTEDNTETTTDTTVVTNDADGDGYDDSWIDLDGDGIPDQDDDGDGIPDAWGDSW